MDGYTSAEAKLEHSETELQHVYGVFFQELRFFGGLRHSQKEECRLKMNHAAEGVHLQEPIKMSIEYGILYVQIVG
ncbi:hypothetical protein NQ318_007324 [Aromia moschata]|uniref:Uncharacterized protein n=1 Tax=Aromia moschata TaxID=1265417 RepID=A0AAV8Z0T6_9CUCU|nr:hypothetical protein NQ318_007324 [Aromia moschata]